MAKSTDHLQRAAVQAAAVFCALLCLLTAAAPAVRAGTAKDLQTVRAGFFPNGDFMHKNDDGALEGYDIEYYYALAGYAGWKIEFSEYDSLNSALQALEDGEIDVMSGLSKTPERESRFIVSAKKMCAAQIAVQTRADDDRFAPGDTRTMADMTCGILRGSNVVALYTAWCGENGLTPHIVEYDSLADRNAALFTGAVDAIAGGSTIAGAQKVAGFPSLDLYFMFNKDRTALKAQLDRAMNILSLESPTFASELFLTYFPATRNTDPSYSAGEKAYLAAHPEIRVALLAADAPFSSAAGDGSVRGILPDYFRHLAAVTGVQFTFSAYASKEEALAALARGEVDLVGKYGNDLYAAHEQQVLLSEPYLRLNMVQILRAGTDTVDSCAAPQCNVQQVEDALAAQGSAAAVQSCGDSEECFRLLKAGKVDAVVCTQPAAAWLLNRNRASDYMVLAFGGDTWDLVCALPPGAEGNTLRAILNKTILTDGGYINQLITTETMEDSASLSGFFDRLPVSFLAGMAIAALLLLGAAVFAIIILVRRRKAERAIAQRQAEVTAAEDAARAKHAFFGAVSHDMRTPLNGIIGLTELALASGDEAQMRGYLEKIRRSGEVLRGLVDDTLVMSRCETGKYPLQTAPTETCALLGEVLEPIRMLAQEKGVEFAEDTADLRCRTVRADKLGLQKILLNLLTNALRFTPRGGRVTLSCRLVPTDEPQPDTRIVVADTGVGMAPEFLPHVFDPFAQENPANTDTTGSGLGLAIVKRIVDAMGGTITVESEKDKGTRFTVRLHLEEIEPAAARTTARSARELAGKRALICEDNELNREILRAMLANFGMQCVCTSDGRQGVDAFAQSAQGWFDVVLLDLRMPVLDGVSAAKAIRALHRRDARTVPILAVSADAYAEDVQNCREAGMDGHIAKPVEPDELYEAICTASEKRAEEKA